MELLYRLVDPKVRLHVTHPAISSTLRPPEPQFCSMMRLPTRHRTSAPLLETSYHGTSRVARLLHVLLYASARWMGRHSKSHGSAPYRPGQEQRQGSALHTPPRTAPHRTAPHRSHGSHEPQMLSWIQYTVGTPFIPFLPTYGIASFHLGCVQEHGLRRLRDALLYDGSPAAMANHMVPLLAKLGADALSGGTCR